MRDKVSIAIIGGGASGTITAINLLQTLPQNTKVILTEKRKEATYRGAAYSSRLAYEPLNVQAGRMSIFNHLPNDFLNWLKANKQHEAAEDIAPDSFVSRRWFGDYLTAKIENVKSNNPGRFELLQQEVVDVLPDPPAGGYKLVLADGQQVDADYLIFATGNEAPGHALHPADLERLNDRYVGNPWGVDPFAGLAKNDDVLIIGAGLTMVDHVGSLHKQGHKGKIHVFSRNGYLPRVHDDTDDYELQLNIYGHQISTLFSQLKREFATAQLRNYNWQTVMDALRINAPEIWQAMPVEAKKVFLKRLRIFWDIHRHRMTKQSAEIIEGFKHSEQLQVHAGRYVKLEINDRQISFQYQLRGGKQHHTIYAHLIINCTGPSGDYFKTDNSLIKNMLAKGWMKQDELKLGIVTGAMGRVITAEDKFLPNAYTIGPLRKAAEWETTALREIRTQAEEVARKILTDVKGKADSGH